jgi:hypothetical protein
MVKILTKCKIDKSCFLFNLTIFFLSLIIVNSSLADKKETEVFPWELFYPAFKKNLLDRDNDGFTIEQGDCNDTDSRINPIGTEICGDGIDQDCDGKDLSCKIILNVPFEPNHASAKGCGTCCSSSFTMILRFFEPSVEFEDVFSIFGCPPFSDEYQLFLEWVNSRYPHLNAYGLCNATIENIIEKISDGFPVVVHQIFSTSENTGHNRVVVGYDFNNEIFFVHDPSPLGRNYKIGFETFKELWFKISILENVQPYCMWVIEYR